VSAPAAPFSFDCHRCGHCCRVGHGRVWVEAEDVPALAALRGESAAAFAARHLVATAEGLSLRERPDGGCCLLEGDAHCTVYAARPEQCRTFPFWPAILEDPAELDRALAYCPGLQVYPKPPAARAALEALAALYARQAPEPVAPPCYEPAAPLRRAHALEADFALAGAPGLDFAAHQDCPFRDGSRCGRPELRPLVCRAQGDGLGEAEEALRGIVSRNDYPDSVGQWSRLLRDRAAGWRDRGGPPPAPRN